MRSGVEDNVAYHKRTPGDPLELRHDALVVLVALRVAVGAGVLLNNLLEVLAQLHKTKNRTYWGKSAF